MLNIKQLLQLNKNTTTATKTTATKPLDKHYNHYLVTEFLNCTF